MAVRFRLLAGAALLLALAIAGVAVPAPTRTIAEDAPAGQAALTDLLVVDEAGQRLIRLDPETLAERSVTGAAVALGDLKTALALSADGSTLVSIDEVARRRTFVYDIVVHDASAGTERLRFPFRSADPVNAAYLSRDGTRLVLQTGFGSIEQPYGWHVFDTADGRQLATVKKDWKAWERWIDPDAKRLYLLMVPYTLILVDDRIDTHLVAYDLTTGAEAGRLDLPDLHAGIGNPDAADWTWGDDPEARGWTPGAAFSSDGRRLVLVHADRDAVTVVDTQRLVVERTVTLMRPAGVLDRLLGLLPLMPQSAAAKELPGTVRRAVLGPDGRYLYVAGYEAVFTHGATSVERGLGLRVVDLETGEIVAEGLPGVVVDQILPSPGGGWIYVLGPEGTGQPADEDGGYVLRRLDARTLATLADREFPDRRWVVLMPAGPAAP